ncbi:hypothetical protein FSP39_009355 [Pinctada imbricata]|uniref:Fibrinogen C-terminal domain-containing protein n=1 Tax=Pinctada imbricata TaxID=66713 RepID=A0AA88XZT9_PINIB|nr:hypothetical protein FSP39_009355 [Pinctada imbricata]
MAYCDMEHDGGGWTVIQRRRDGSVSFDRDWASYRDGFGNRSGEFWLGNDHIHDLTRSGNTRLRIEVMDWLRVTGYAEYQYFNVQSESSNYRLSVGSYKGNIGDSFNYPNSYLLRHNQMAFSTKDRDHDNNFNSCARVLNGGWWFNSCYSSNLNGQFSKTGPYGTRTMGEIAGEPTLEGTGVEWYPWKHKQYSLLQSEMKIRPEVFP